MGGTLTFPNKELAELLEKAKLQWPLEIRPTYGDDDPQEGFWIVGDQGVYIMHNGKAHDQKSQPLVYAREVNPETDPDGWWDAKRAIFGGDDGVDFIARKTVEDIVAAGDDLAITLNSQFMSIRGVKPQ